MTQVDLRPADDRVERLTLDTLRNLDVSAVESRMGRGIIEVQQYVVAAKARDEAVWVVCSELWAQDSSRLGSVDPSHLPFAADTVGRMLVRRGGPQIGLALLIATADVVGDFLVRPPITTFHQWTMFMYASYAVIGFAAAVGTFGVTDILGGRLLMRAGAAVDTAVQKEIETYEAAKRAVRRMLGVDIAEASAALELVINATEPEASELKEVLDATVTLQAVRTITNQESLGLDGIGRGIDSGS